MENERFALDSGRRRPAYTPKDIHCPGCGAGLTVKDERSELVVCEYCGSHLDVSQEEKQVLGKGAGRKWNFPLALGDSFRWKKARYEIISRMVFIEDGDEDEASRQYLLYNPYHSTLWLDEYDEHYSLSSDSHIMPVDNPFGKRRGDLLKTHDKQEWVMEGSGTYELVYVDGALPWIAKIGDRIDYAEFVNANAPKLQYEVQRIGNEIEYGKGEALSREQMRRATGQSEFAKGQEQARPVENVAKTRRVFVRLLTIVIIITLFNGILYIYASSQGKLILEQQFAAQELTQEVFSDPFSLSKTGDLIKIKARSNLDNAWMALDIAVVWDKESVIHVEEADISYYHGYEGGESWKEGSQNASAIYVKLPWAGTYQLMLHAISARGNATSATEAVHGVTIQVYSGAMMPHYFMTMGIISSIVLVLLFVAYNQWKRADDED